MTLAACLPLGDVEHPIPRVLDSTAVYGLRQALIPNKYEGDNPGSGKHGYLGLGSCVQSVTPGASKLLMMVVLMKEQSEKESHTANEPSAGKGHWECGYDKPQRHGFWSDHAPSTHLYPQKIGTDYPSSSLQERAQDIICSPFNHFFPISSIIGRHKTKSRTQ